MRTAPPAWTEWATTPVCVLQITQVWHEHWLGIALLYLLLPLSHFHLETVINQHFKIHILSQRNIVDPLWSALIPLSLLLLSGLFCEEEEGVCSPGRNPCQHQSTCISTPTGPRWHTHIHTLHRCPAQQSFRSQMGLKIQTHIQRYILLRSVLTPPNPTPCVM